jgi:carbonic anhydrase
MMGVTCQLTVLSFCILRVRASDPVDWKDHGRDWTTGNCANHDSASPINFEDFQLPLLLQKQFSYNYDPIQNNFEMTNDGYTIFVDVKPQFSDPSRDMGGIKFDNGYHYLDRIEFHSQSDHTFQGKHMPLEIQFTHKKKNSNSKIIVAILVTAPDEDQLKPPELLEKGSFLKKMKRATERHGHQKGKHTHRNRKHENRRMRGKQEPDNEGMVFPEPDDPGEDEMEKDLGITEADEDGMAEVVLGPRKSNKKLLQEDFEEINEYKDWDLGVNYTIDHPDMPMPPSSRSTPKILPAGVGPYGLAVTGRGKKREDKKNIVYNAPSDTDPEFSPMLQAFLNTVALPLFEETITQNHSIADTLNLNALFDNSTFFEYGGTQTTPPCEGAIWLVRREVMMVSTAQAKEFFKTLHEMSEDAGNYRTLMPVNSRVIEVRKTEMNTNIPPWRAVEEAKDDSQRIISSKQYGMDAVKIAETAANYVRDMDTRLKRAAIAHAMELRPKAQPTGPPAAEPPGLPYSEKWLDPNILKQAMGTSAGSHAKMVSDTVGEFAKQATGDAANMAANATLNNWQQAYEAAMAAGPAGAPFPGAPAPGPASVDLSNT